MTKKIIISGKLDDELTKVISNGNYDKTFTLVDTTTETACWPLVSSLAIMKNTTLISIGATDEHKDIRSLSHVWNALVDNGATRHSCLINLGGGMITDLGGFAASTFKRGIDFINVPTTLLAMIDASVGGKTGINFNGLKNEIGVFNEAKYVIINTKFIETLDRKNILSGYAEMLKHALINNNDMWAEVINFDFAKPSMMEMRRMIAESVDVKERIVAQDPTERGIRKALNLGHTIGHAFEEMSLRHERPILHGYAVAFGMICELYLSTVKRGFPTDKMRQTVNFIRENYGQLDITCDDYDDLIELMRHDKKNSSGYINFTLLADIGDIKIDNVITEDDIKESLDFFREG